MSRYMNSRYAALDAYVPGEQPKGEFIKLNANESPDPPSPGVLEALRSADGTALNMYPDAACRALDAALEGWETRIPTGQLNAFLGQLVAAHPHPLRGGKQPRILFGTQASSKPPRFVLFTTGFLDPGYRRFIERRLRETFGFAGTPIQISVRVREKRRR